MSIGNTALSGPRTSDARDVFRFEEQEQRLAHLPDVSLLQVSSIPGT